MSVVEAFLACFGWLMRRGKSMCISLMFLCLKMPQILWTSVDDHRHGRGFYSDPLGKPSLLTHWGHFASLAYGTLTLFPKPTTDEGLAAAGVRRSAASVPAWDEDGVAVNDKGGYLEFAPPPPPGERGGQAIDGEVSGCQPLVGVIFLPGALILPTAYAPLARTVAKMGYPSYVVRFEFNLATNGWEIIGDIISDGASSMAAADAEGQDKTCPARSTPTKWVLVGHSMGTMAIELFYAQNPENIDGVVYMGSGNMIGDAMTGAEVPAMVLRGSRDPFCLPEDLAKSAHKLPKDTETVVVEGGNHRGFASYTRQPLDWEATITEQEQRRIVVEALVDFIDRRVA